MAPRADARPVKNRSGRVDLADLARLAGVEDFDTAYELLRLGRSNGRPETSAVDTDRVAVVAVLGRLRHLLPDLAVPADRHLEGIARLLHAAVPLGAIGAPRSIVVPVAVTGETGSAPAPVLSTRANVGALLAGRAGIVLDLGPVITDWSR